MICTLTPPGSWLLDSGSFAFDGITPLSMLPHYQSTPFFL